MYEKLIFDLLDWSSLHPRKGYRNPGEQIDGSFVLNGNIYLLEIKYTSNPTTLVDVAAFEGKLLSKPRWSRGLFISHSGFSPECKETYTIGRRASSIFMDSNDIRPVLHGRIGLKEILEGKLRSASESNLPFTSALELFPFLNEEPRKSPPSAGGFKRANRIDFLEGDQLKDFHVWWDQITESEVQGFENLIDNPNPPAHKHYVAQNPRLLIEHLRGGHGRYVIPGNSIPGAPPIDFLIAERSSIGFEWTIIELENPQDSATDSNGKPTSALMRAHDRIEEWRSWLDQNLDRARRDISRNGLGLGDIEAKTPALILIGRRTQAASGAHARIRLLSRELIQVHTYDWLVEYLKGKAANSPHTRFKQHT
ncbi:Shedu anti-phage system protein SduA domain-containing protein [Corallococcus coralloides]|uniref:Shedu anti-phage system protein SduA domain-containing protein n=1 Tax=Corallococcus coralloides TaxID=184914 RepID=UPI00384DBBD5